MRIVAKIGTASITDDAGVIDAAAIAKLCDEVAALRHDGHQVIVVSSGAVAAGVVAVGLPTRPTDMATLQAVSAAGQSRLVEAYNVQFDRHGLVGAQVLRRSPRLRRPHPVPPRPPHARAAARTRLRAGGQRERRDRQPRTPVRRQRPAGGAGRQLRRRRPARAAHRHRRRVHRRSRVAIRPPSW